MAGARGRGDRMTLIATAITRYGIVQAADPGLTSYTDRVSYGPRIFKLGFLPGTLAVTGEYAVAGEPMDRWMRTAIRVYRNSTRPRSLSGFVEHLRERLTAQPHPIRRRAIHVAGYETNGAGVHPEVYYLRNIRGRARDGGYGRPGREFVSHEQFWNLDYAEEETRETIRTGGVRMYLDGFAVNRIAYMVLHQRIHEFYEKVWQSSTRFRTPRSIEDMATLVELDMRVNAFFLGPANHHSRRVRNSLQIELTPAPTGAGRL